MWWFTQDIIRYILVALFLAFGCAVYAISASFATGTDAECNGHAESTGELDTACELREHATYYTVVVVSKNFWFISFVYH